jgi:hypothetical protein
MQAIALEALDQLRPREDNPLLFANYRGRLLGMEPLRDLYDFASRRRAGRRALAVHGNGHRGDRSALRPPCSRQLAARGVAPRRTRARAGGGRLGGRRHARKAAQGPLTDSNRRPPPYHVCVPVWYPRAVGLSDNSRSLTTPLSAPTRLHGPEPIPKTCPQVFVVTQALTVLACLTGRDGRANHARPARARSRAQAFDAGRVRTAACPEKHSSKGLDCVCRGGLPEHPSSRIHLRSHAECARSLPRRP